MSTPLFPVWGVMILSPSRIWRPASSSTSRIAFSTPRVTSSKGASTVVGASPRTTSRYSPFFFSIRMALVVVLPQSVARTDWTSSGSCTGMVGSCFKSCIPPSKSFSPQLPPRLFLGLAFPVRLPCRLQAVLLLRLVLLDRREQQFHVLPVLEQ